MLRNVVTMRYLCTAALAALMSIGGCRSDTPVTVVCIGDSLTACGGQGGRYTDWLQAWLPEHTIVNKGVGGNTLADGRARFEEDVMAMNPDVVVIELGANDFWQRKRPVEALGDDLEDMVSRARQGGIQVVIASCFGRRDYVLEEKVEYGAEYYAFADAIAKMEEQLCEQYGCFYVPNMQADIKPNGRAPYWEDDYHPNKQGNKFVAKRILNGLKYAIRAAQHNKQAGV